MEKLATKTELSKINIDDVVSEIKKHMEEKKKSTSKKKF